MLTNENVLDLFKRQDESIERLEGNLKEFVVGSASLSHANLIIELTPIKEQLHDIVNEAKIQNGRIKKNEDCLKVVEKETNARIDLVKEQTRLFRWMSRNLIATALLLIGFVLVGAWGYHKINMKQTLENTTGVVIENKK